MKGLTLSAMAVLLAGACGGGSGDVAGDDAGGSDAAVLASSSGSSSSSSSSSSGGSSTGGGSGGGATSGGSTSGATSGGTSGGGTGGDVGSGPPIVTVGTGAMTMSVALSTSCFNNVSASSGGAVCNNADLNPDGVGLPRTGDWLWFDPWSLVAQLYPGELTQQLSVLVTAPAAPSEHVNVLLVLDSNLFDQTSPQLQQTGPLTYRLLAKLKPGLPVGRYRSYIDVRACLDEPTVCSQPYPGGARFQEPLFVTVLGEAASTNPTSPINGDFSSGTTDWWSLATDPQGTAAASLSVARGALHVKILQGGARADAVQVKAFPGISLEGGKRYRLRFDAWADFPRTIVASVNENGRDLDLDGSATDSYLPPSSTVFLGPWPRRYQLEWTQPVTNRAAALGFLVGGSRVGVHLDNVTVTELP